MADLVINNLGGYDAVQTDLTVVDSSLVLQGDSVGFGNELLWVARVIDSVSVIVQRGYAGSTAAVIPDGSLLTVQVPDTEILDDMSSGAAWNVLEQTPGAMVFGVPATSIGANLAWSYVRDGLQVPANWARVVFSIDFKIDHQGTLVKIGFSPNDAPVGYQDGALPVIQDAYMISPVAEGIDVMKYFKRLAGVPTTENLQDQLITDSGVWRRATISLAKIGSTIEISGVVDRQVFGTEVGANTTIDVADIFDSVLYPFIVGSDGFTNRTNQFRNAKLQVFLPSIGGDMPKWCLEMKTTSATGRVETGVYYIEADTLAEAIALLKSRAEDIDDIVHWIRQKVELFIYHESGLEPDRRLYYVDIDSTLASTGLRSIRERAVIAQTLADAIIGAQAQSDTDGDLVETAGIQLSIESGGTYHFDGHGMDNVQEYIDTIDTADVWKIIEAPAVP